MASERSSTRSSVNTPRVSADTRPTQQQRTLRGQRMATAILFIFMLCAAALGAYYTFVIGVRTENDLFSKQWQSAVTNLVTTFNAKLAAKVAAGQLAASYFTFSAGPSAVFPFVSYPAWNVLAWSMNATANVRAMAWLPLVLSSQVDAFWAFANATVGVQWANATAAMLGYGTKAGFEAGVALVRAAVAAGPYGLPSAVRVPINASDPLHFIVLQEGLLAGNERAILYDALSEPIHAAAAMEAYTSQNASISDFLVLAQDVATGTNRFASVVYTPVFQGASVVGLSNSYWMWDTVVESALPTFFTGIVVVVTSTSTGKSITMVGGPNGFSSFEGDASGSKSVVPSSAVRFVSSASVGNTSFAIVVYPTTALLASYETDDPRNHAIEVVAVVAACILLFALQNWLVRSHSVGVSRTLDATSRLLDDVFPKGVRARVVESMARRSRLQQAQALADTIRGGGRRASADTSAEKDDEVLVEAGLVPTLAAGGGGGGGGAPPPPPRSGALLAIQKFVGLEARIAEPARASVASSLLGRGVADAFPSVSVVFSDVVGFTSWSSTVAPEAVFAYLCALFGAFDKMGARHGAYKMETVGDAYMAVCGLPEPDARHAERAADFALSLVTAAADVGRATGVRLALRVGVHSGPVLAGVLLGERARFQLFGDTVNVASRMESTGAPGRVQISSATAELLSASCPGSFECTPRGAVDVKGKGCLDTSWLVRRSDGTRPLPVPRLSSHHFAPTPARPHQPPHPPPLFSPLIVGPPPTSSTVACPFSSSLPPLAPAGGSGSSSFASGSGSGSGNSGEGGSLPASPPWWRPRASSLSANGGGGSGATHPSTPPQPPQPPPPDVRRSVDSARPAAAARLFHGNSGGGGGGGGFFGVGAFWPATPPRLRSASLDSSTETGGGHAFEPSSALPSLPAAAFAAAAAACGADAPADNADDGFYDGEEEEEEEGAAGAAEAAGGGCSRGPACGAACEGARGEAAAADVHPWCGSPV